MGCAPIKKSKKSTTSGAVATGCVLPRDQSGTLTGQWSSRPIPIALEQTNWSPAEISAIVAAAEAWNGHFVTVTHSTLIDYVASPNHFRTSSVPRPALDDLCNDPAVSEQGFRSPLVIYKVGAWPYTGDAIAVTNVCPETGSGLPRLVAGMMEINYANFFVQGRPLPDLQSIVAHELGHLIGVNHSCEGSSGAGVPNCGSPGIPPSYLSALMFPSFSFRQGVGEQRRELNENDQGRANCLYGP